MMRQVILLENFQRIKNAVSTACIKVNRNPKEVTLMAVTKYAQDADILTLLYCGLLTDIGESRVQQAWVRWHDNDAFAKFPVRKHFIGHLQKNKVAKAAQLFDFIDSLDDVQTAKLLSKHTPAGKVLKVLVQVKLTDKNTQSGLALDEARKLVAQLKDLNLKNIRVCGYMGIAPQGAKPEELAALFQTVKSAFDADFPAQEERYLSLGMSEDFITAVEEGSTLPRIGSGLFAENLEGI